MAARWKHESIRRRLSPFFPTGICPLAEKNVPDTEACVKCKYIHCLRYPSDHAQGLPSAKLSLRGIKMPAATLAT